LIEPVIVKGGSIAHEISKVENTSHLTQIDQLYKTLDIPKFNSTRKIVHSAENNVHFCSSECSEEAHTNYGPLLQSLHSNEPPIEAAKTLDEGGFVSFNLFSRLLTRATRHPQLVEDVMNRFDAAPRLC
jgi:hypothetical protein